MPRIATAHPLAWITGLVLLVAGCSGGPPKWNVLGSAPLPPCPSSPNCVSSEAANPDQSLPPLPYAGTREASRRLLLEVLNALPRTQVVAQSETAIQAECRSRLFGFVDDLWFRFDDPTEQIHFRSAARSGHSDFGVNRERMQAITQAYLAKRGQS